MDPLTLAFALYTAIKLTAGTYSIAKGGIYVAKRGYSFVTTNSGDVSSPPRLTPTPTQAAKAEEPEGNDPKSLTLAAYIDNFPGITEVWIVARHREEHFMRLQQRSPEIISFAANAEEAFEELLVLSGLDAMEISQMGLIYGKVENHTTLCRLLAEKTGDTYSHHRYETRMPIRNSVMRMFKPADEVP